MGYEVLVVDDSATIRSMVKKSIALSGLQVNQVHEARNGQEALRVLREKWIDIVFTDLHMPEVDGIELVERMNADQILVGVPVVVVSSDRSQEHLDRLRKLGVRAYIKKPFRPESVRDVVLGLLDTTGEKNNDWSFDR